MATTDTENYLRLHLLEVNGGTPVLRKLLIKIVGNTSAGNINKFLKMFKDDIRRVKPSTSEEYKILFPSQGGTSIDKWDISLLAFILLSCCTIEGQLRLKGKLNLQDILKQEVRSSAHATLDTFLSENRSEIEQMKETKAITREQFEKLFPTSSDKADMTTWDIELLVCLLFRFCSHRCEKVCKAFRDIVARDVALCDSEHNDLRVFLKRRENVFDELKTKLKLTVMQYKQLFPSDTVPDLHNWENDVLQKVVLNVCQRLSAITVQSVKTIKCYRKHLVAHRKDTEINNENFLDIWVELSDAIKSIVLLEFPELKETVDKTINGVRRDPLDINTSISILKETYTQNDEMLARLAAIESAFALTRHNVRRSEQRIKQHLDAQYRGINEKLDTLCNKTPDVYSQKVEIKCVDVIITVKGNDREAVRGAEDLILKAMKGKEDDDTKKIRAVTDLIKEVISKNGNVIVEIRRSCIVLVVQCVTYEGLHALLKDVFSNEVQDMLNEIMRILANLTNPIHVHLTPSLTSSSIRALNEDLQKLELNYDCFKYKSEIRLRVKSSSINGLATLLKTFHDEGISNHLQILSGNLSDTLQDTVVVSASLDQEVFQNAVESAEQEINPRKRRKEEDVWTGADNRKLSLVSNVTTKRIRVHGDISAEVDVRPSTSALSGAICMTARTDAVVSGIQMDRSASSKSLSMYANKETTYTIKCSGDTGDGCIRSCTILPTGEYILADRYNGNIKLFDSQFHNIDVMKHKHWAWGTCLSNKSNREIYVTFPNEHSVYCLKVELALIKQGTLTIQGKCYGICCWKNGLGVTVRILGRYLLQLIDYDGRIMKQIGKDPVQNLQLGRPWYITCISNGQHVVISDGGNSHVTAIDVDTGHVVFVYTDDSLDGPRSVTSDSNDNLFVLGGGSHNVHVLSASGEKLCVLLDRNDGLNRPEGICHNGHGNSLILQPDEKLNEMFLYTVHWK